MDRNPYQVNFHEKAVLLPLRHYNAWQLIKIYWASEWRVAASLFFSVMILMTIGLVGFDVVFNYWYNYFYDALQAYNVHSAVRLLVVFFLLAGCYIVLAVYRYYVTQLFSLRWRRWLTKQFIGCWLSQRGYYYLESFDERTDNPDQRIQEDVGALVNNSVDLSIGLVGAVTTFFAFIYILWQLSGDLHIPLGPLGNLHIPGYLVWVSLLYALIGTLCTFKIGRPLILLNFEQQRREATFRFAAIDLRSHAEHVALYRGEEQQKNTLHRLFGLVLDNWYAIILRQKLLLWFTAGYNQVSVVLPLVVALPNYFGKVFLLGGLIQSMRAFGSVQESLSFMINSYTQIAQWRAVTQRLTTFINHLSEVEEKAEQENHLHFHRHPENIILVKNVSIHTPRGEPLLHHMNEALIHGKNYLIKGPSGIGKSTFIRTLAGIWPYASGDITLPEKQRFLYLPQKPYMPIGTLSEAILFPDGTIHLSDQVLQEVLRDCHLEHLIPRLHDTAPWSQQLSPGEQQRVAFVRVLLQKPDWVFLDESTSMLDLSNETYLYQLLTSRLPHCSIVSVGHRPSLDVLHDQVIEMSRYSRFDVI